MGCLGVMMLFGFEWIVFFGIFAKGWTMFFTREKLLEW